MKVGDVVMFRLGKADAPRNGSFLHPAVVSRVFAGGWVNVVALIDGVGAEPHMTVLALSEEPQAHDGRKVCWPA